MNKFSYFIFVLFWMVSANVAATETTARCLGNIETFDKKVIKAGVEYFMSYEIVGDNAQLSFAGRTIAASAEQGKSYKGMWLKNAGDHDDLYLSFLPEEGGDIKFKFEDGNWFSGNCK